MILELKDTTLSLAGVTLWTDFSLIVKGGVIVTLSGWTRDNRKALMEVIWGLLPLDQGFVSIDGELITTLSAPYLRKKMAYLPHEVRWADEERNKIPFAEQRKQLLEEIVKRQPKLLLMDDMSTEEQLVCRQLAEKGTAVIAFIE
jgi:ABC-type uncharacterized transport system ATPase subunit